MPTDRTARPRLGRASVTMVLVLASMLAVPSSASAVPTIVAAGDIAAPSQPSRQQSRTARLIRRIDPRAVLTLGDNQYNEGRLGDFRASYAPTWGTFRRRTYPAPGNHDYGTSGAAGYFDYFGRRAHRGSEGMYGFNIGRWHLVSINSGEGNFSGAELKWVRRNLRRDRHRCEIAYWHHPRWSSGTEHGSDDRMAPLWRILYRAGVDVVMNGHEHNYERFALMNPAGRRAPNGIRQFVVGTGGRGHYNLGGGIRGSQVRIDDRFGVLKMRLHQRSYRWSFVAVGGAVLDRGRHGCHR